MIIFSRKYMLPVFLFNIEPQISTMKKTLLITILSAIILGSCAHGISPYEAANGKARCGKTYIK
jgi:hypothetical protein